MQKIKQLEYELLCNDLEKIQSALDDLDISESNEIRRLNHCKTNILADIEKIEGELVRENRKRERRYINSSDEIIS